MEPSPYLPSTRRFFNPIYLRVERIPEYAALPAAERTAVDQLVAQLRPWLDAERRRSTATRPGRRSAPPCGSSTPHRGPRVASSTSRRTASARATRSASSPPGTCSPRTTATTPGGGRTSSGTPAAPRSRPSRATHADRVDFECWLQWVLDEQLQQAQAKATGAGMRLGVMHDLAVGVHPGGADAWRMRDVYAQGVQVGAPPDPYNQLGQDWSQPPWRPDRLAELGYQPFRDLIGAVLRHAGGVRVDHVIGLFRLWWIPTGRPANEGTYVRYDHAALIGVLALEAHRAGAVVVGEDLGVVAPEARDFLRARGILGTSILWFERGADGGPLPAEQWREWCLASVTTHDLPPTAGYLAGDQVRLQHQLGPARGRPRRRARLGARGRGRRLAGGGTPPRPAPRRRHRRRRRGPAPLPGAHPGPAALRRPDRRGGRPAYPEPAGHHERVPQLAGPAGRAGRRTDVARGGLHLAPRGRASPPPSRRRPGHALVLMGY